VIKRTILLVATLATAFGLGAAHATAAAHNLVVDDDKAQCPNAQYTTIQAAVAAASPGDTIKVCPGTYSSTTVDKAGLKLKGATGGVGAKRCLDATTGVDPATDSIVNGGAGAPGFRVAADDVRIAGFTIQGASNDAGVSVPNTVSGTTIAKNLIQKNTMGVFLNSNGAHTSTVDHNCVRDNNVAGSGEGNGVYSDAGLKDARISHNVFTAQTNASVILVGHAATQSNIAVEKNSSMKDAPFIFVNLTDSKVRNNASSQSAGSGIFFGGGSSDVLVSGNRIENCAFTGINIRFDPANYNVTSNNTALTISGNRVTGCGDAGIRLRDGASGNVVRGNRTVENGTGTTTVGDGIGLEGATNNRVEDNRSERNLRDGLRADATSTGNQIANDRMLGNKEHDCHDDSHGAGTAGTANQWVNDHGVTQTPPGICTPKGAGSKGNKDESKKSKPADNSKKGKHTK
jgi:parallel beta-helix repeat protein